MLTWIREEFARHYLVYLGWIIIYMFTDEIVTRVINLCALISKSNLHTVDMTSYVSVFNIQFEHYVPHVYRRAEYWMHK